MLFLFWELNGLKIEPRTVRVGRIRRKRVIYITYKRRSLLFKLGGNQKALNLTTGAVFESPSDFSLSYFMIATFVGAGKSTPGRSVGFCQILIFLKPCSRLLRPISHS